MFELFGMEEGPNDRPNREPGKREATGADQIIVKRIYNTEKMESLFNEDGTPKESIDPLEQLTEESTKIPEIFADFSDTDTPHI